MKTNEPIENTNIKSNEEPAIKTDFQAFWLKMFDLIFHNMVKKAFYSVRIKNAEYFNIRDKTKGNIIFSNHNCWWDGLIGYLLVRKVFKTEMHMMIEELHRFPLLAKIGAFSVEKSSASESLKALNYSVNLLKNPNKSLWIYPEGIVRPPDYRPVKFASGISYICKKLDGVNLIPVANRYNFIREDRPEIFLEIGKPIILNKNNINRKEFTLYLEEEFTKFLDSQKQDISSGNLNNYEYFMQSRLCIVKLVEKYFNFIIPKNINT